MDTRTWLQWGLWERRLGNIAEARDCFLQGIAASPVNSFCWQSLALLEAQADRPAQVQHTTHNTYDTIGKTCTTLQQLLLHRAIMTL
jgi:hypothetical protein